MKNEIETVMEKKEKGELIIKRRTSSEMEWEQKVKGMSCVEQFDRRML